MDYFQGVVADCLRRDRANFVHPEFLLQLVPGTRTPDRDTSWWADVFVVNFRTRTALLGEVTYSRTQAAITRKLSIWQKNWNAVRQAIQRDAAIPEDWEIAPWIFVPRELSSLLSVRLGDHPEPLYLDVLEDVLPWARPNEKLVPTRFVRSVSSALVAP